MKRKTFGIFILLLFTYLLPGCGQGEKADQLAALAEKGPQAAMPGGGMGTGMGGGMGGEMGGPSRMIEVDRATLDRWEQVRFTVTDNEGKTQEITVPIGGSGSFSVGETAFEIMVIAFLPNFSRIEGEAIVNSGSDLVRPAVRAVIREKLAEKEKIWTGWLFQGQDSPHGYQHEKAAIALVGAVERKPAK